ncbi:uncharacterized protein si:ch73-70k4.1 [Polypterus senegalus]|uniref:uncharacterized protein si:ch73-70k4.1 n=1 Tax=Polypterus senegalus TaxID=55291 RepID=UPI00196653C6|nr:uncharacterized protein si:ch73-70k4.1 [Polypterus senegalus]XP_039611980.1 uncharacterized protein si:ch73-70k4.1 [Polypterus senegalus]XP_039611981.1 uncharacterized protein si:ch73-70k4.1 [Polypterus senegalus]XP_039611982.1 uncharacterized protein si:ch73-70k4.1 [Polypterus senegalus]
MERMSTEKEAKLKLKKRKNSGSTGINQVSENVLKAQSESDSLKRKSEGDPNVWWTKADLNETDHLWLLALKSAVPNATQTLMSFPLCQDLPAFTPQVYRSNKSSMLRSCSDIEDRCAEFPPMCSSVTKLLNEESYEKANSSLKGNLELASCPLCLLQFPARYSQMEIDGHLAKCLSEMNDDILW